MTPIVVNRCHSLCVIIVSPGVRSACVVLSDTYRIASSLPFICNNNLYIIMDLLFFLFVSKYIKQFMIYMLKNIHICSASKSVRYRDCNPNSKWRPSPVWTWISAVIFFSICRAYKSEPQLSPNFLLPNNRLIGEYIRYIVMTNSIANKQNKLFVTCCLCLT